MDDCDLEKLTIKPGKLAPQFHKNTTEYNVTVASNVEKIRIDPLTSDTGASYQISGSGGEKEVPLPEGLVTDIKIEVTSEDGTVKNYFIHVKRLSAKDAVLSNLQLSVGSVQPEFSSQIDSYLCTLPTNVASVKVKSVAPDPKNVVMINEVKSAESLIDLNVGQTNVDIEVTSADGSNKKKYTLTVIRKQIPRFVQLKDPALGYKYECPISLAPLYRPITICGSDPKRTYSAPYIDTVTRTSKVDPLSGMSLEGDWRIEDIELEAQMSSAEAAIPLIYGGLSETSKFREIAVSLDKCNIAPKAQSSKSNFNPSNLSHTVKERKFEQQLQQVFGESNVETLTTEAKKDLQKYFQSLPQQGIARQYEEGQNPIDFLTNAAQFYAVAIKNKPKDATLHFRLAMVLEERYIAEDLYGLKKEESTDIPSFNLDAKESSKSEECDAICKLHGVDVSTASLVLQLKAIDQEFHQLVNSGQQGKADHVQGLYAWKSKQAMQEGAAAQKAADDESPLGQAYLKYMDALALDEAKAVYNFHVGRMLVVLGNYTDAITRLEAALNWNAQLPLARAYLGLALTLQKDGPGKRSAETIEYLLEATELLLTQNTKEALSAEESSTSQELHAENLLRKTNVHLLRGMIQLGTLLLQNPDVKDTMSPSHVFHNAALVASQNLHAICKGDTYKQVEWVLLDAHTYLLNMLSKTQQDSRAIISQRCERLSSLIFNSSIPMNEQLLDLQKKTCQNLVSITPCSSNALYLLGAAQFAEFESTPAGEAADKLLNEAISSFQACIVMEGKPMSGSPPEKLTSQNWWIEKQKKVEDAEKAKTPAPKAAGKPAPASSSKGPAPAAARAPAGRGAKPTPTKSTMVSKKPVPAKGPAVPAAKAAPAKGPAAATKPTTTKASTTTTDTTPAAVSADKTAPPLITSPPPASTTTPGQSGAINQKSYLPRLGLARAMKAAGDVENSGKYYNEVIAMAPEIHDAYIESAEMLAKSNPTAAVDVYCKFPISENPTFDDAFIIGEIVRLLMKAEKYDDKRLVPNLIIYGKVLGLPVLERYVKVLENSAKFGILKEVYAGINGKSVDDSDMVNFFKFKCWL